MPGLLRRSTSQPADRSGYEDLLLAGETLRSSRLFKQAEEAPQKQDDVLLALKRRMLIEPPVVQALDLIKSGMAKPAAGAPAGSSAASGFTLFHDLAALLEIQQYVYLSQGRLAEGLNTGRTCVRLGRVVTTADRSL